MGMDGLSIANTGVIKDKTSAEYANKTEQSMQADPTNSRQVQSASVNQRVRSKEEEEENEKKKRNQKENSEDVFEDGMVEEPDEEQETEDFEDVENPNKDFYVKLNAKDDIIELYDTETNRLIETISGNELGELVQKLNMASGIFVNKKV